jgi:hypothetical protein
MAGPTVCETWWGEIVTSFNNNHDDLVTRHPDCTEELGLILTVLHTIGTNPHLTCCKRIRCFVERISCQSGSREDRSL